MKKTFSVALFLIFCLSYSANALAIEDLFPDVSQDQNSYTAIQYLYENGIVQGYDDGTMRPAQYISRSELLKILIEGRIDPNPAVYKDCFPDVQSQWYAKYVCYAADRGWVEGYQDGTFRPKETVRNHEATKMILEVMDVEPDSSAEVNYDYMTPDDWWYDYYGTAIARNLMHSQEKTFYLEYPDHWQNRGNAFDMLYRIMLMQKYNSPWFEEDLAVNTNEEEDPNSVTGLKVESFDNNMIVSWDFYPDITAFDNYALYMKQGSPFTEADLAISIDPIEIPRHDNFLLLENVDNDTYYFMVSLMEDGEGGSKSYFKSSNIIQYSFADPEYYENTTFGYKINLADGYDVSTEGVAMMPVVHNESIWIRVEFDDGGTANLNSMENPEAFPELNDGRINLTAEEYVSAWWDDNYNDDNPNVTPILGQIFQTTLNGITWYGFTADNSIVSANGTGGGLLEKPLTVLVAKNNGIFYRWGFDADLEEQVYNVLENFEFNN